nr:3-coathanger stack domain-containing protein [Thiolapillus sp.]
MMEFSNGFVVLAPDGNVTFTAKTGIQLGAGFVVQTGALFRAVID